MDPGTELSSNLRVSRKKLLLDASVSWGSLGRATVEVKVFQCFLETGIYKREGLHHSGVTGESSGGKQKNRGSGRDLSKIL